MSISVMCNLILVQYKIRVYFVLNFVRVPPGSLRLGSTGHQVCARGGRSSQEG